MTREGGLRFLEDSEIEKIVKEVEAEKEETARQQQVATNNNNNL